MMIVRKSCDELAPGMILAEDVHDADGRLLVAAGAEVTDRLRRLLADHGIERVALRVEAPDEDPAAREQRRLAIIALTERRFRHARGQPVMDALAAAITAFRLRENGFEP
jgi:hypothetical protein